MAFSPSKSVIEGTTSLLNSEKYSDLTITTQTRSFKAHKAIICTQSPVLAAMSDAGFKESSTGTLALEHDDPATVQHMITFFYTGNYDPGNPDVTVPDTKPSVGTGNYDPEDPDVTVTDTKPSIGPILMANTLVYSIADKYDIENLKALAKSKFETLAPAAWACEEFPTIVATVFDSTPDTDLGLRGVVSQICAARIDELLASETWTELIANDGAIGVAVFKLAHESSVLGIGEAKGEILASERKLELAESGVKVLIEDLNLVSECNDRLRERLEEAHEEFEGIMDKWKEEGLNKTCVLCEDRLFEGLGSELAGFKDKLVYGGESRFL